MLRNENRIEIETRFIFFVHLLNYIHILKQYTCQMIKYLIFQIVIYHIVVLIDGENRWKKRGVVDCRYLASIWTIRLFNRCCDICKDLRLKIPGVHSNKT